MAGIDKYRVPWEATCWRCEAEDFTFKCTDELTPLDRFIGQDRALDAIRFGLEVDKPGYNLFLTGLTGTGKTSAIKAHLQAIIDDLEKREKSKLVNDWCYAHNFDDPDRPKAFRLAAGTGKTMRSRMSYVLALLREQIPKVFKSEEYEAERRVLEEEGRQATQQLMAELERSARDVNFTIQVSQMGMTLFPMVDSQPMSPEEYQALPEEQRKAIDDTRSQLMQQTQDTMTKVREKEKESSDSVAALERLVNYVLDNLNLFKEPETPGPHSPTQSSLTLGGPALALNPFLPFEVNVLVDNGDASSVPIVIEPNPSWGNLFGRIERRATMGTYFSDHSMLKPGSIHQANGGYLVLNARDVLMYPPVWEGLKRVIRNRELRLEDPAEQGAFFVPQGLRP